MAESDPNYARLCEGLKKMATGERDALLTADPSVDGPLDLGAADLSDAETSLAYSREQLTEEYLRKVDDDGGDPLTIRDADRIQSQAVLLAAAEKAARLRYRTRTQALIWGAARSYGQSQDTGYFGHVLPSVPMLGGG